MAGSLLEGDREDEGCGLSKRDDLHGNAGEHTLEGNGDYSDELYGGTGTNVVVRKRL